MLIGLGGFAGSGKDTTADLLAEHHGFRKMAFADAVRAFCLKVDPIAHQVGCVDSLRLTYIVNDVGWDIAKKIPEVRALLQRVGSAGRDLNARLWIDRLFADVDAYAGDVVISDVRFPNEVDAIRHRGGSTWRLWRRGIGAVNGHESEHALNDMQNFDLHIANNGSPVALAEAVDNALKQSTTMADKSRKVGARCPGASTS